jgi:SET domain-containing protein
VTSWRVASPRYQRNGAEDGHTFFFGLDGGHVVKGAPGGKSARRLNHCREPNCEAEEARRVFMQVLADIMPDEALFIDYLLDVRGRRMAAVKKLHAYRWARCTAEERCSLRGNVGHCVPASSRAFRPDGATGFLLQRW